ncbi:IS110 family transposase [Tenacibaculum finnmarkense]|uniref:IS110 family transposase n=1 Tax=Tenacibaculum finnmarkense TaxID=2781243 RepID=UPI001E41502C|nr:IS110 family transposase [Tenacibaculum finnmarkense]MCD8440979.1 IS110 family transposase [Tenacibaculum finnmarkense genomovar ulcerans]MCG8721903.1 IS110 family transposase [Tenacibaculum finnmarkense]
MNKYTEIFGVDISKDVFDVHGSKSGHNQFKNDALGFKSFLKNLPKKSLVVMEATGYYHYRLAQFLFKQKVSVSVVNPLSVKRFIQMKLAKVKTDKSDSKAICEYSQINEVPLYTALTDVQSECLQLFRLLDSDIKKRTATKNKIHGEEVLGIPSRWVYRSLKRTKKHLDKEIKGIEARVLSLVKQDQQVQLTLLTSIPGIGLKTALFMIVITDGFDKFESAKQLCSYVGITPTIRESGSSVRGRSRISKVGNRKLRNLLFLCSFTACKYNKGCRDVYERIVNKGKSKKLALIAVSNKLIKQSFAIAKSGLPYDETYVSVLPK